MRTGGRAKGSNWKVTVNTDADTRRRSRENQMAKIRSFKRNVVLEELEISTEHHARKKLKGISSLVDGFSSHDINLQLKATIQFSELLSTEQNPLIDGDIQLKLVSRFLKFLEKDGFPQLQCEAAWALANIASKTSEGTKLVIERAMPVFVRLLHSPYPDVREQVVFALGVVAGHSTAFRDCVLHHGVLQRLLEVLNISGGVPNSSMLRNASWTLSNICGGVPPPSYKQVRPALEALKGLLGIDDWEVLSDSCLALSSLSSGGSDQIDEVIRADVCPALVNLLLHPSSPVVISALHAIANIVSNQDRQTKVILELGALEYLLRLLNAKDNNQFIKKEACFVISNITGGQMSQKQAVINARLIEPLVQQLKTADVDTCVNAALALSNAASGGSRDQIKQLASKGCIDALCNLVVHSSDYSILYTCLDGLVNILKMGGLNVYNNLVIDAVGYERIMDLANSKFEKISRKAFNLLFVP